MLANAVSHARIQYFIHLLLGPPRDLDWIELFGVELLVGRFPPPVLQLVYWARRPVQDLRDPKHIEHPVLLESLGEQHFLLSDPHRLTLELDGRSPLEIRMS